MPDNNVQNQKGALPQLKNLPRPDFRPNTPIKINPELLMNRLDQAALMKEMLNLPQDFKQILALLQSQNQEITPEVIKQLLDANSKEVVSKLVKLIQQSPHNAQNHEQLKQLLSLISLVVPARDASPQEVMTQFMLLYLPWLPLSEQQKVEVRFEKKQGEEGGEDETVAMVVFISTINLGRFKVTLIVDKNQKLDIMIQNIEAQEKDILKTILKAIKGELQEENIKADTHMAVVKQQNFAKSTKREVTISQVNNISPLILITAQKVARIILEHDEKAELVEVREKRLK